MMELEHANRVTPPVRADVKTAPDVATAMIHVIHVNLETLAYRNVPLVGAVQS